MKDRKYKVLNLADVITEYQGSGQEKMIRKHSVNYSLSKIRVEGNVYTLEKLYKHRELAQKNLIAQCDERAKYLSDMNLKVADALGTLRAVDDVIAKAHRQMSIDQLAPSATQEERDMEIQDMLN